MVGIENDPLTARIAQVLYPDATIRTEGYEDTRLPEDSFEAGVGNVPFGNFQLTDPSFNSEGLLIHDHFINKTLRLTSPGGLVALITSTGTLDKLSTHARQDMAQYGDLLAAVRLPNRAMFRTAGTTTATDILLFQSRAKDAVSSSGEAFERTLPFAQDDLTVPLNEYFHRHPDHILGDLQVTTSGQYGASDVIAIIKSNGELIPNLATTLTTIVAGLTEQGIRHQPKAPEAVHDDGPISDEDVQAPTNPKPGTLAATKGGTFVRYVDGTWVPHQVPSSQASELRELLHLRNTAVSLIEEQGTRRSGPDRIIKLREVLNTRYDTYLRKHGPINRVKIIDGNGKRAVQRRYPPFGGMRAHDPSFQLLAALEIYDDDAGKARKSPIFTVDVLKPRPPVTRADTLEEACAITIAEKGNVDVPRISQLLDRTDLDIIIDELHEQGLAFTEELIPAVAFLSGNVRARLALITEKLDADPDNLSLIHAHSALEAVLPDDVSSEDIFVKPGVTWIPPSDYKEFVFDVLELDDRYREHVNITYQKFTGTWEIEAARWFRSGPVMTSQFGTEERDAITLLEASMNNATVEVFYPPDDDGKRVKNTTATLAAQDKKTLIDEAFSTWIFTDPDRTARLATVYNTLFNSCVSPTYDGTHLTIPGLGETFTPRPHQRNSVARIISEPTVLLDHAVGAGKTGTMVMAAMELRRLGRVHQPWLVVPNHLVDQVAREALLWAPSASLLTAPPGLSPAQRRTFVATTATADFDLVILAQSVFSSIPVSTETELHFVSKKLGELEKALEEQVGQSGRWVKTKDLERAKKKLKARHDKLSTGVRKDLGLAFEASGCDYFFIDEAHGFKNKAVASSTRSLNNSANPSQKAEDLDMKLGVLRERGGRHIATFSTATPVANSLRELYVMQAFLDPEGLENAGVATFDTWANNFTRQVTALEPDVTGTGFRLNTRIAQFVNIPELVRMVRQFSDVVAREDIDVPIPTVVGGRRRPIVIKPSEQIRTYFQTLTERARTIRGAGSVKIQGEPEDNMLRVINDGRNAALDPRIVGLPEDETGGRVRTVASEIYRIHVATKDDRYVDDHGHYADRTGSLQLVFLDRSTPKKHEWNLYEAIRDELVAKGMDRSTIRFIHDATTDPARRALRDACLDGRTNVLIGSTEKMGTGMNVQTRAVALHHIDCPWRPADLEQREGRIIRQGNNNSEVEILGYATEQSLDTFMWACVQRKQAFIASLRRGEVTTRSAEDIGDVDTLSYGEIKAAASGKPRLVEREELASNISRYATLERTYLSTQRRLKAELTDSARTLERLEDTREYLAKAIEGYRPTDGDQFTITLNDVTYRDRIKAGNAFTQLVTDNPPRHPQLLGHLGGYDFTVTLDDDPPLALRFPSLPLAATNAELPTDNEGYNLIRRLENSLGSLPKEFSTTEATIERTHRRQADLHSHIGRPFDHADALDKARRRLDVVEQELTELETEPAPATASPQDSAHEDEIDPHEIDAIETYIADETLARIDVYPSPGSSTNGYGPQA